MKKLLALTLALLMVLTVFASCSKDSTGDADTQTDAVSDSGTTGDTEADTGADTEPPEPWKPPVNPPEDDDELKAPEKAPNEKTMTLVSVMDGTWTKPFDAEAAAWTSESTDKTMSIFDNNATVDLNEYSGFMVRVKPNEDNAGIYLRFFFKMADGTEIEILAKERNLNWYNGDSWTTIKGATSNWKLPIGEEGYAYIEFPLAELAALTSQTVIDIKVGSYATSRSATFSEWTLVKGATTLTVPTKLADGTKIELVSISDGTYTKDFTQKDQSYATELENATTNIFANGATVDLSQYKGLLVKKTPDNENEKGIYIRFKVKYADGTEVEIKAQNRELGWFNGSWGVATTATSNWKLTLDEEGYVFLDFSKIDELKNKVISDICIYNSESDRSAKFTEWSFVKVVDGEAPAPEVPPVVKPEVPALKAPSALNDGTPIKLVQLTDGILEAKGDANANAYASAFPYASTSIFANGGTVDLSKYKGMIVKVSTSEAKEYAGLYVRFFFKVQGQESEIEIKAKGRSLWYYDGTAWTEITSGATASNWTTAIGAVGYIYLAFPLDEIAALESAIVTDIRIYSSKSANRIGMFSDFSLVEETVAAPKTLADGTAIELTSITDGTFTKNPSGNSGCWASATTNATECIFDNGATVDISQYSGFLVKKTPNTEGGGIYVRFKFKVVKADGTVKELDIKADGRTLGFWDGTEWIDVTSAAGASNWKVTPIDVDGYIYIAFPLKEITAEGTTTVSDIYIYSSSSDRSAIFENWSLVKTVAAN